MGAIYVTPGPLTVFRRKVFNDLGGYRHGHNTEDMELAFRMQKNHYKIVYCNDAYVYTNTPSTIKKLYKQRVRWVYGFINNVIDYRSVLFRKKYGNFATLVLPLAVLSCSALVYMFGKVAYNIEHFIYLKLIEFKIIGLSNMGSIFTFDPFFINYKSFLFFVIIAYVFIIFAILLGRKMSQEKNLFSFKIFYYFPVFFITIPFSVLGGLYGTVVSKKPSWR